MCISYKVIMNLKNDKKQKKSCFKKEMKLNIEKKKRKTHAKYSNEKQ